MLYVALVPGWVWTLLLTSTWFALAHITRGPIRFRHPALFGLLALAAVQAIVASAAAVATNLAPIDGFACGMGYRGMWVTACATLAAAALLAFALPSWPRTSTGRRRRFAGWFSLWLCFAAGAFLAHARSAVLCTV